MNVRHKLNKKMISLVNKKHFTKHKCIFFSNECRKMKYDSHITILIPLAGVVCSENCKLLGNNRPAVIHFLFSKLYT